MAAKTYNTLNFKERLVHHLHDQVLFKCDIELKQDEFHTCADCQRRANAILMFLSIEIVYIRQEKI